jgi:hypothetical protein
MNNAPEIFLQVRRHMACCNLTFSADRHPGGEEADDMKEARSIMEVEAFAKNHRMTCRALKEHDAVAQ